MTDRDNENLEELLAEFYDAGRAEQAADEIQQGEQVLRSNPARQPAESLIADIKSQIAMRLPAPRTTAMRLVFAKAAAVAAVFVILAWAGARFLGRGRFEEQAKGPIVAMISHEIWESGDIAVDDPALATISEEIEETVRSILTIRLGERANGNGTAVMDIEMELIEIESEFWKG